MHTDKQDSGLQNFRLSFDQWERVSLLPSAHHPGLFDLSADKTRAYVVSQEAETLSVVDIPTRSCLRTILIPDADEPWGVAVNREETRAYITNSAFTSRRLTNSHVTVIDLVSEQVIANVCVGVGPNGICLDQLRGRFYVANKRDNTVSVVNLISLEVIESIHVGAGPFDIKLTHDQRTLVTVNFEAASLTIVDPDSLRVLDEIIVGTPNCIPDSYPEFGPGDSCMIAFTPNSVGYVTNFRSRNIGIVHVSERVLKGRIAVARQPFAITISPDQKFLVVTQM
jgi:YVTN family beta-propeller protein